MGNESTSCLSIASVLANYRTQFHLHGYISASTCFRCSEPLETFVECVFTVNILQFKFKFVSVPTFLAIAYQESEVGIVLMNHSFTSRAIYASAVRMNGIESPSSAAINSSDLLPRRGRKHKRDASKRPAEASSVGWRPCLALWA